MEPIAETSNALKSRYIKKAEPLAETSSKKKWDYILAAGKDRDAARQERISGGYSTDPSDKRYERGSKRLIKREKGIQTALKTMNAEAFVDDYPAGEKEWETPPKPPKKVRPSKSTWYKNAADAGDVKTTVDPKMHVRFSKEAFEERFAKTLDLFEVSNISELDEEMTKMFMALVQSESKSDEEYRERVYDKIKASKRDDSTLTPEQIRYRAEKKARADKAQSVMDAAKKELASTKQGSGWSKLPSSSA